MTEFGSDELASDISAANMAANGAADRAADVMKKPVALIGMMGAGKSAIGKLAAAVLGLEFVDADKEIEAAADATIPEIFERHGEEHFRDGERRVIARLIDSGPIVLATGGGAYMDEETRAMLRERAITIWLRADFDVLWRRVSRRSHRPLLKTEDPKATLAGLIEARYPTYSMADIIVDSDDAPKGETARRLIEALERYLGTELPRAADLDGDDE